MYVQAQALQWSEHHIFTMCIFECVDCSFDREVLVQFLMD